MERIHYAGDSILTGTDIARALLDYAQALALADRSDTVDIPIRREDGTVGTANMLIGPASQLVSESGSADDEADEAGELRNDEVVADMRRRIALLHNPRPMTDDEPRSRDDLDEY